MGTRLLATVALALAAGGCGETRTTEILPWCRYRQIQGPGGSGMWSGSNHTEVQVRRWWGWKTVFDGQAAPGKPIVVSPTVVLVESRGSRLLRRESGTPVLACGSADSIAAVAPQGGFVDCVDFVDGPARGVATSLRVRRLDPGGRELWQWAYATGVQGRVFLMPAIAFYDEAGTAYLVTFRDPWARHSPASAEQLSAIECQLVRAGEGETAPTPAPPGHTVADCSSLPMWAGALGRPLLKPVGR